MTAPRPLNLPDAFSARVSHTLGPDFPAFLAALDAPALVSIRLNAGKGVAVTGLERVPWSAAGYYLPARPLFAADPRWHAGGYYVQEASSMFLEKAFAQAVAGVDEPVVLDLAAAPGGKSTHLAALLPEGGLLVANEVIRARAHILAENLTKWGAGNAVVTQNDPTDFGRLPGLFDVMLVDAPCSGEGLFRKEPDAVREWSEANVQLCAERQQRILADAWAALKPGGVLIYSTCTYEEAENEANLRWLLAREDVENVPIPVDPAWGVEEIAVGPLTGYRFWPHRVRGEGLFMAAVRKTSGSASPRRGRAKGLPLAMRKELGPVADWLREPAAFHWLKWNEKLVAISAGNREAAELVFGHLKVVYPGTEAGELVRTQANPSPGLALSTYLAPGAFPAQDLDLETALRYLRREDVVPGELPNGWGLVSFAGLPMGWVKRIGNRANNYWPKEWRLRMDLADALRDGNGALPFG
jgi:16S rRNA C967 or C1407 C5-methylase (RsmB/RsmF family)